MSDQRDARDVMAEAMRRERYGLITPQWRYADEAFREPIRQRAALIIRALYDAGYAVVALAGANAPAPTPAYSPIITRDEITAAPGTFRMIRAAGGPRFDVILEEPDEASPKQTVECSFTMAGVSLLAGRVLQRDAKVREEPNLLTKLAAATEVYRLLEAPWIEPGE